MSKGITLGLKPIAVIAAMALSSAAHSQAILVAELANEGAELNEVFKDDVPVSGKVIAGINITTQEDTRGIVVAPATNHSEQIICVQVISKDGRYWSENEFRLPLIDTPSSVLLAYDSEYDELIEAAGREDLATLSFLGKCSSSSNLEYLAASGPKLKSEEKTLLVFVNSGRADVYASIQSSSTRSQPSACTSLTEGRRTGYDTICELTLESSQSNIESTVTIYRRRFENVLPSTKLSIWLP